MPYYNLTDESPQVKQLAARLGETAPGAIRQIRLTLANCDTAFIERCCELATGAPDETSLRKDGTPRTLGGRFFAILKRELLMTGQISAYREIFTPWQFRHRVKSERPTVAGWASHN